MNAVATYLENNRRRLALDRYGIGGPTSCVVITPRFRASSHVVVLVLCGRRRQPVLVAKLPRLKAGAASIEREASNLRLVLASNEQLVGRVPEVVACDTSGSWPLLLETALVGKAVDPVVVRRDPDRCCRRVIDWLIDLTPAGRTAERDGEWFDRHVARPLDRFSASFPVTADEAKLLERTRARLIPLADTVMPVVFEHGDLSHPNILDLGVRGIGVIDWEMADPRGLPLSDALFFASYVAFARANVSAGGGHVPAFREAFFGRAAWARSYVRDYALRLGLPGEALTPLFVFCWLRALIRLLARVTEPGGGEGAVSSSLAAWVRANRYYELWRYAVEHAAELIWEDGPARTGRE